MQYGHKLVVFATKKFVIPLSLSRKVNTAEIFRNSIIQKFLFSRHKMGSLSDAFKSQDVIKQTARGVPKHDIKKLDLIEITLNNNFHTLYCTHIPRRPCYLVGDCITECQHCSSVKQTTINISEDSSVQRGHFSGTCHICDVPKRLRWRHCVQLAMTQFAQEVNST